MTQSAVDLFDQTASDDFLNHMLSSSPSISWSDLPHNDSLTFSYHPLLPTTPYSSALPPINFVGGDNAMYKEEECVHREWGQLTTPHIIQAKVGGGGKAKQRVRARRGQATDPHSIAERLRRERIAERMKALQELVPNANKSDKASMLDEIIDYVKFLQLQVKVLSMSRLGGAAASLSPPLLQQTNTTISKVEGGLETTEKHVAKLLEEDMGAAMQYLQGKGLCLMPISLATTISSAARNNRITSPSDVPLSPSVSIVTSHSTVVADTFIAEPITTTTVTTTT